MVTETSYGLSKKLSIPYEEASPKVKDAPKEEGFGVIRLLVNPHGPAGRPTRPGLLERLASGARARNPLTTQLELPDNSPGLGRAALEV